MLVKMPHMHAGMALLILWTVGCKNIFEPLSIKGRGYIWNLGCVCYFWQRNKINWKIKQIIIFLCIPVRKCLLFCLMNCLYNKGTIKIAINHSFVQLGSFRNQLWFKLQSASKCNQKCGFFFWCSVPMTKGLCVCCLFHNLHAFVSSPETTIH